MGTINHHSGRLMRTIVIYGHKVTLIQTMIYRIMIIMMSAPSFYSLHIYSTSIGCSLRPVFVNIFCFPTVFRVRSIFMSLITHVSRWIGAIQSTVPNYDPSVVKWRFRLLFRHHHPMLFSALIRIARVAFCTILFTRLGNSRGFTSFLRSAPWFTATW